MSLRTRMHRSFKNAEYYVRLAGLTFLGPAQLDEDEDPIVALRREHGRLPTRRHLAEIAQEPAKARIVRLPL